MIITNIPLKVYPTGPGMKYKKGIIQFRADTMEKLGWENRDLVVCVMDAGEEVSDEEMLRRIKQMKKVMSMENELAAIKKGEDYEVC